MKRDNNSIILWVVLAAAVLVGVYVFRDKLGICWSGDCKTEQAQEAAPVEVVETEQVTESEMPASATEEAAPEDVK